MVDRDTCAEGINKFLKSQSIPDAITLLDYLCDIKNLSNKDEALKSFNNSALMGMFISHIIEELITEFKLSKVLDKFNTLILVY